MEKYVVSIEDKLFTKPDTEHGDGYQAIGRIDEHLLYKFNRCVFDFRTVPLNKQDELVDMIFRSHATFNSCLFIGGIKAVLVGNGDHPSADAFATYASFYNCAFINCGRRCPEVQDGAIANMSHCWIHNWGVDAFNVRAFGAWAHRGASLYIDNCIFTRTKGLGFKNYWIDKYKHIGQAVKQDGIAALFKPSTYISGKWRGLTCDTYGTAIANLCYRNDKRIIINKCDEYIDKAKANNIIKLMSTSMNDSLVKNSLGTDLYNYYRQETLFD